ncbi:MAG: hypothetical protein U0350_37855 [Caldilineaceae bacterium]
MVHPPFFQRLIVSLVISSLLFVQASALVFAAPGQDSATYLPVVITPPVVSPFQLATNNTCADTGFSTPVGSPATFASGIKQLLVATTIDGGVGLNWRLEWTIGGKRETGLDKSGTLDQPLQTVSMSVVYGPNGTCSDALPRDTYTVRLLLNGTVFQEATATIR